MTRNKAVTVLLVTCVFIIIFLGQIVLRTSQVNVITPYLTSHLVAGEYHSVISEEEIFKNCHQLGKTIMSEKEALSTPPCKDIKSIPSATRSSINIIDAGINKYNLGDTIRVSVQLKNEYGNRIQQGGHLIRSTMSNETLGAYSTGLITDNLDGTYLVEFEALWTGTSVIMVAIDYSREAIAASYRLRNIYLTLNKIVGTYINGKYKENVLCHPDAKRLISEEHYKDVCNYTALNSGHQWYCGIPSNSHLHCKDWHLAHYGYINAKFPLTDCEQSALLRVHNKIRQNISVHVHAITTKMATIETVLKLPKRSCVQYNITNLWYNPGRTGFFYAQKWKLRQCKGVDVKAIPSCLNDKTLYLMIGDSTVRQWYSNVIRRFNCTQITEQWTNSKWNKLSACFNEKYNFTTIFSSHNFPYNANVTEDTMQERLASVTKKLDKIPSNQKAIVLIHIYAHLWGYHHRYYREKMLKLREGVERLIRKNPFAKVLLKIPHTFTDISTNGGRSDISGYVFIDIIKDVFHGMYDKVIYLDNREASTAVNSKNLHPEYFVVSSMVNQMFSFVCE